MISRSVFDEEFFRVPCYRLHDPVSSADITSLPWLASDQASFIDAKIPAGDLTTAQVLMKLGFRKICTQVELLHDLRNPAPISETVSISETLTVDDEQIRIHAMHFETSRFRQDPALSPDIGVSLYSKWLRNSLSGKKRVVHIETDFCTFEDKDSTRWIDLLSIIKKRQGRAKTILATLIYDAKRAGCARVRVITEVENAAALRAYVRVGFIFDRFLNIFHRYEREGNQNDRHQTGYHG